MDALWSSEFSGAQIPRAGIPGENPCPVSLEQMTSGVSAQIAFISVLSLLSKVVGCVSSSLMSGLQRGGLSLAAGSTILLGSPQEKTKPGMEAGKVQSLVLSGAFSPDLISQEGRGF